MDASINCKKCELKTRHTRDEKKKLNTCCICGQGVRFKKKDFLVETLQKWHDGRPEGESQAAIAAGRPAAGSKNEMDGHRSVLNFDRKPPGRKSKYTPAMKAEICRRLGKERAVDLAKEFKCKMWTIYGLAKQGREFLKGASAPAETPPATRPGEATEPPWARGIQEARLGAEARAAAQNSRELLSEAIVTIMDAVSKSIARALVAALKGHLK